MRASKKGSMVTIYLNLRVVDSTTALVLLEEFALVYVIGWKPMQES